MSNFKTFWMTLEKFWINFKDNWGKFARNLNCGKVIGKRGKILKYRRKIFWNICFEEMRRGISEEFWENFLRNLGNFRKNFAKSVKRFRKNAVKVCWTFKENFEKLSCTKRIVYFEQFLKNFLKNCGETSN